MSEPPWEKMYRELEERHVALAQKVIATAAFLDRLVVLLNGQADCKDYRYGWTAKTAAECRAEAAKLRG